LLRSPLSIFALNVILTFFSCNAWFRILDFFAEDLFRIRGTADRSNAIWTTETITFSRRGVKPSPTIGGWPHAACLIWNSSSATVTIALSR